MTRQDAKVYPDGEAPDLGSIAAVRNENGIREYRMLSTDVPKLNSTVTYCADGSSAYCVDTGDVYMFLGGTWYKQ